MGKHTSILIDNVIEKYKPSIIAEIGVNRGHSMRRILRSESRYFIKEYWAVDLWNILEGDLRFGNFTIEDWDYIYLNVARYMPWFSSLRVLRMPSIKAATIFWDGYFDFVYIDADHSYEGVKADIAAWLPKVKKGGIIGGHDYEKGFKKGHRIKEAVSEYWVREELELYGDGVWLKHL